MSIPSAPHWVRFDDFAVDLRTGELLKNGVRVRVQIQPFRVLELLLERPGEMVTREELREKLWPQNTFVDFDDGLNTAVRKLRQVVGDSSEHPKYIETLPRRGYRFIGSLRDCSSATAPPIPEIVEGMIGERSPASSGRALNGTLLSSAVNTRWSFWATAVALLALMALLMSVKVGGWRGKILAGSTSVAQQPAHLAQLHSIDPQASEAYAKGRFFCDKWTNASARKAIDYFQQAIQREPNYALAYAGMADAYIVRTDISPQVAFSSAKAMARAALQIDDSVAEAHTAMAFSLFAYDWDWVNAEREFQRAIAINPDYAMAHQWYGQFQKAMGRQNWDAEVKRAHQLDPLSLISAGVGQYIYRNQYDQAIANVNKRLELDPQFAEAYFELGRVYERKGQYPDAIRQFQKGFEVSGGEPQYLAALGYAYGVSGNRVEARRTLTRLMDLSKKTYVSPYEIAVVHVGLGQKDLAFDWLQKAITDRSYWLLFLRIDERMEIIRSDPRFQDILKRVNLPS
ncbi:MAG TPA: tetratricopeptide repeat protein [Candidatus Acidoferrales bacterium]|nr:tetratricopeptide repeat protein [Candidatus Acidoferrales bacterium]